MKFKFFVFVVSSRFPSFSRRYFFCFVYGFHISYWILPKFSFFFLLLLLLAFSLFESVSIKEKIVFSFFYFIFCLFCAAWVRFREYWVPCVCVCVCDFDFMFICLREVKFLFSLPHRITIFFFYCSRRRRRHQEFKTSS